MTNAQASSRSSKTIVTRTRHNFTEHHSVYLERESPAPTLTIPAEPRASCEPLQTLEVEGLTYRYRESKQGIEGISFTLQRGSMTVVTGGIGAGKTTLLRALLGLLEPQAGQLRWNGHCVERPGDYLVPPQVPIPPKRLRSSSLTAPSSSPGRVSS